MSKELEVVAWARIEKRQDGTLRAKSIAISDQSNLGYESLVRLSDAQAEIAGLKTYAATIAAERDAALTDAAEWRQHSTELAATWSANYDKACDERDALAKELAEAKAIACDCTTKTHPDGKQETYCGSDQMMRSIVSLKAQSEPVGYIDAEQLRRWDALRGTAYESEERCYMPFSRAPFKSDMSDCSLAVFTHPAPADLKDAERLDAIAHEAQQAESQWQHAKFVQRVLEAGNQATAEDRATAYWMVREFRDQCHAQGEPKP